MNLKRLWSIRSAPLLGLVFLLCPLVRADTPVKTPAVSGSLRTEKGVRVLRLWGTPDEQGYAHGYLMGENLLAFLEGVLLDSGLVPSAAVYDQVVRPQAVGAFEFTGAQREELAGILRGMMDRCGPDRCRFEKLGRAIDVDDLIAINTLADWVPGGCSSFAVWGGWTEGGETIVGRNLDYQMLPGINIEHLLIVRLDSGESKTSWVSIAWPGLIGAYSAMSEHGMVAAMHDAPAPRASLGEKVIPRSIALRDIIEKAFGDDAIDRAQKLLAATPTLRGNNFLVAGPSSIKGAPAAVFEYDGDQSHSSFATRRNPGASVNASPDQSIVCTNHYRSRGSARPCRRYNLLADALSNWPKSERFGVQAAWRVLSKAAVDSTLHSFVALPDKKEFWVSFSGENTQACENEPVRFELAELLRRSPGSKN